MESIQYDLLKEELRLTQNQVDKYDELSRSTKTWAVTLWVASSGWAFQSGRKEFVLIAALVILIFWFFDGISKTYRMNYKNRRNEIQEALRLLFRGEELPEDFQSPDLPTHEERRVIHNMLQLHLGLPYIVLILVSLLLFVKL
jgi:hypothetical protein